MEGQLNVRNIKCMREIRTREDPEQEQSDKDLHKTVHSLPHPHILESRPDLAPSLHAFRLLLGAGKGLVAIRASQIHHILLRFALGVELHHECFREVGNGTIGLHEDFWIGLRAKDPASASGPEFKQGSHIDGLRMKIKPHQSSFFRIGAADVFQAEDSPEDLCNDHCQSTAES